MTQDSRRWITNMSYGVIFVIVLVVGLVKMSRTEDDGPCSPTHFPGSCYQTEREVCQQQWDSSQNDCHKQIEALNFPPARLTGPIMDKCQQSKFDRVFRYMRKDSADCRAVIDELETWRKSNPDF